MFSILIPTLNNAKLLHLCLSSIACTQKDNNQVVIYDNDSSDHTEKIVQIWKSLIDIDYKRGENISQYHALDDCYSRAKYDWCFRIHTDMFLVVRKWEQYFERAIAKALHPWKWLMCARSIEPVQGHTKFHIIADYGKTLEEHLKNGGSNNLCLYEDFRNHKDNTIITGYREPFLMHKKLYEQFDKDAMLKYKAYCGDDHTVMQVYHLGVRRFWMINGVLVYHMVTPKGGQTNTSADSQDKDENWPYEFFVEYWRKKGYNSVCHPGQYLPRLIPEYVKI